MRFSDLPNRLQGYIVLQPLFLAPLLYLAFQRPMPTDWWLVSGLAVFTVIFSTWKLELTIGEGRMTPVFATVCLAMLLQGAMAAVLCSALGALVTTFIRPPKSGWQVSLLRPRLYYAWFNLTNGALAGALAALAFDLVVRWGPQGEWNGLVSLTAFTTCYFLVNTVGVTLAIAYQQQLAWLSVWQQNFLWTAPGFFASAAAALGINAAFPWMGAWSLLFLSPLYLIYYSYRLYMDRIRLYTDRVQENMLQIQELNKLNEALITSLARAIGGTQERQEPQLKRVQYYARALAEAAGLTGGELEAVAIGSLVHDVGRRAVPDHVPGKPARLSPEASRQVRSAMLPGADLSSVPARVVDLVLTQHERWDGQGYPCGLQAEEIPLGARIMAIVGMFDQLTSNRPFRRAISQEEALKILREGAGRQLDPGLVELFEEILPEVCRQIEKLEAEQKAADPRLGTLRPGEATS